MFAPKNIVLNFTTSDLYLAERLLFTQLHGARLLCEICEASIDTNDTHWTFALLETEYPELGLLPGLIHVSGAIFGDTKSLVATCPEHRALGRAILLTRDTSAKHATPHVTEHAPVLVNPAPMMEQRPLRDVPSANDIHDRAQRRHISEAPSRDELLAQFLAHDAAPESCDCPSDEYVETTFVSDEQHRRWHTYLAGAGRFTSTAS
jgi:hypothetical protein